MTPESVGLYVHVPFCRRKCTYCDFVSYTGLEDLWPGYLEAVLGELVSMPPLRPRTLYVGGGTPTGWPVRYLAALLAAARSVGLSADAEVSLEANPGTVDSAYLERLREAGFNRISVGVQSSDDESLRLLGRIHSAAEGRAAVVGALAAGFANVSIDLIYGLPGQTLAAWRQDLERVLEYGAQHMSVYALSLEEGTPLARAVSGGLLPAPESDVVADMYEMAADVLAGAGFVQYEISNWAKPRPGMASPSGANTGAPSELPSGGKDVEALLTCEHNLIYWRREPYLGLGAGAHSCLGGRRFARIGDPRAYVRAAPTARVGFSELVGRPLAMAETAMLALRLTSGLSRSRFERRFGVDPLEMYGDALRRMSLFGLVAVEDDRISLTRRGQVLSNEVFELLLPG